MSDPNKPAQVGGEHGRAVERLDAAVEEQSRVRDEHDQVAGTSKDVQADASLRAADERVVARERWLTAVEDHDC